MFVSEWVFIRKYEVIVVVICFNCEMNCDFGEKQMSLISYQPIGGWVGGLTM